MVKNKNEHTRKSSVNQGPAEVIPKAMKIGASTPYDFQGSNMTAYGGLLPVAAMLEKLQFQELIERHVTISRLTTSMPGFRFMMAMILALYVGFSRLNHLQFLEREPMLTGILQVSKLPVQSTFWGNSGFGVSARTWRRRREWGLQQRGELTGVAVSKPSLGEILPDAAQDFDAFYQQRSVATPVGSILVAAVDGKGIPMVKPCADLPRPRLTKGQKANKKRMVTVATVFTRTPWVRTPQQVLESLFPTSHAASGDALPPPNQRTSACGRVFSRGRPSLSRRWPKKWAVRTNRFASR
jgi:hypothetical protein